MGKPREPKPAKLFMSLIAKEERIFQEGMEDLGSTFGKIDFISEKFPFNFTNYYATEMGDLLFRHFITFERLVSIPQLPEIKQTTNHLEEKYAALNGSRRINIDPGYICLEHVILATTKAYTHRPYLREGIYADLTLIYRNKSFQPLDWTYPDYRQEKVIQLFNRLRKRYWENLKEGECHPC
ncbi:MAG: DUF4416 family protein [Thermodesulfobacteriota bacterium]|nr:DUF4416 family protein [Thermodesulfobacteriota bacterium]